MSAIARLAHQARYDLLIFRRNPAAMVFTVVIPTMFFIALGLLLRVFVDDDDFPALFTSSMMAFAIIGATFVNLAMTMTIRRERGVLKRLWGTPVSPWMFVASQSVVALAVSLVMAVLFVGLGSVIVGLSVDATGFSVVVLSLLIGVGSLVAMGLTLSTFVPSEEAAPSVVQGVALPLYFISGIFFPMDLMPSWIGAIGRVLPFHHFARSIEAGLVWDDKSVPFEHWAVVLAWGVAAAVFVIKRFRWTPRR